MRADRIDPKTKTVRQTLCPTTWSTYYEDVKCSAWAPGAHNRLLLKVLVVVRGHKRFLCVLFLVV